MSKAKFDASKELIAEHRYDEARGVLRTIGHPTAEKWLQKLDEIDPPAVKLPPTIPPPPDYELILKRWVEVEKTLHLFGALFFMLIAAYLWIANPLREIATFLLFDKPQIRDIVLFVIPLGMVAFAGYAVWRSTRDDLMRRFVLQLKPTMLYMSDVLLILQILLMVILGSLNRRTPTWIFVALGVALMFAAGLSWWRATQAQSIVVTGTLTSKLNLLVAQKLFNL